MLLKSIKLTNVLSFGERSHEILLRPLNVIIGPNGSGKSNLIEAIDLLRSAPTDLLTSIRDGGGVRDWMWKGAAKSSPATVEAVLDNFRAGANLRYTLSFREVAQQFEIVDERIEYDRPAVGHDSPYFFYRLQDGQGVLNVKDVERRLSRQEVSLTSSILSQRKDPDQYPEITHLGNELPKISIYREWGFGRHTTPRLPQKADLPNARLASDASNLGMVLSRLRRDGEVRQRLLQALRVLYDGIDDFDVQIEAGTVQVFLHEGRYTIPATRLSDGTLRYLCLLAILCHPEPPPLVCIEEPELGLHPDVLPTLAELLKTASEKMQLIMTTHSDVLVDAMTDRPEAVLVAEKGEGGTTLTRLNGERLRPWLERYRLGPLWTSGEIGGTRW